MTCTGRQSVVSWSDLMPLNVEHRVKQRKRSQMVPARSVMYLQYKTTTLCHHLSLQFQSNLTTFTDFQSFFNLLYSITSSIHVLNVNLLFVLIC